jgi:hypothetical protein
MNVSRSVTTWVSHILAPRAPATTCWSCAGGSKLRSIQIKPGARDQAPRLRCAHLPGNVVLGSLWKDLENFAILEERIPSPTIVCSRHPRHHPAVPPLWMIVLLLYTHTITLALITCTADTDTAPPPPSRPPRAAPRSPPCRRSCALSPATTSRRTRMSLHPPPLSVARSPSAPSTPPHDTTFTVAPPLAPLDLLVTRPSDIVDLLVPLVTTVSEHAWSRPSRSCHGVGGGSLCAL